ncbi:LPS assembly lipoprotein LptE [Chlamydia sp. 17-3921]|uniref:LPS assembly lipoprotein LptE n=1 Tax=Chlamydia sp. 17-3921 TaxID=2675798 RepID=UPI001918DF0F|nr:LPS assembly lipoprotein LptE [Chlamydia sp. 17-3921]
MRYTLVSLAYVFLLTLLSSCWGYGVLKNSQFSSLGQNVYSEGIHVAPITKDSQGQLTSALTYELNKRSLPINKSSIGYILKIEVLNAIDENIGFMYAPSKLGDKTPSHFIVSNEGRLSLSANVQLIHSQTGQVVIDQCISRESVSFDFEPDLGTTNSRQLSLGQYEMHSEAIKSAWRSLYISLAETIVQQVYYDLF